MEFVDALGNTVLTLSADPNGYVNIAGVTDDAYDVFISKGDFANYVEVVEQLKRDFEKYKTIVTGDLERYVMEDEIQDNIDPLSEHPVQSKTIYQALEGKQDKLVAGAGISIQGNTINAVGQRMVTLTQGQYRELVDNNLVDRNTYYFTYEGMPESNEWRFGDPFPIIFTETWEFGGTFPITLS
jgi:hypothetical protein